MIAKFTLPPLAELVRLAHSPQTDTNWSDFIRHYTADEPVATKYALKKLYGIINRQLFQQHYAGARHCPEFYALLTAIHLMNQKYKFWHQNFIDLEIEKSLVKDSLSAWDYFDAGRHQVVEGLPAGSLNGNEKLDFYLAFTQFLNSQNSEYSEAEEMTAELDYFVAEFMRTVPRTRNDYTLPATLLDAGLSMAVEELIQLAEQVKNKVLEGVNESETDPGKAMFSAVAKNACLHECINHASHHINASQSVPGPLNAFVAEHFDDLLSYSARRGGIEGVGGVISDVNVPNRLCKTVRVCLMLHALDRPAGNVIQTFRRLQLPFEQNVMAGILLFHSKHKIQIKRIDRGATSKVWSLWQELEKFVGKTPDVTDEKVLFDAVRQQITLFPPELLKYLCSFFSAVTSLPDGPQLRSETLESYYRARATKWMAHRVIYRLAVSLPFNQYRVWNRLFCLQLRKKVASKRLLMKGTNQEIYHV